jgi:hypothetical protein
MTRAAAIMLGALAASLVAAARPPDASASVLCLVRKKSLVVRDQCKAREEQLTPDRQAELGLAGPPGVPGTPGPATGGLRVIDAVGREVGVVTNTYGYAGVVTVVGAMTLPGRSAPEFVTGQVDGNGLMVDSSCRDFAQFYETPTCQGQAYTDCTFGGCANEPGTFFARPIFHESTATGCFVGEPSEAKEATFFRRSRMLGSTVLQLNQQCRFLNGGTLIGVPVACKRNFLCADCCIPGQSVRSLVPVHSFDASLLGTPQFRLIR